MVARDSGGAYTDTSPNGLLDVLQRLAGVINDSHASAAMVYQVEYTGPPIKGRKPAVPDVRVDREGIQLKVFASPMRKAHLLATLVLVAGVDRPVSAQTNAGQIAGVVRDAQGGALPGATVIAEHLETGYHSRGAWPTRQDDISSLPPCRLLPRHRRVGGLQTPRAIRRDAATRSGRHARPRARYRRPNRGRVVSAETPLLQTTNAEVSDIIENREGVQLPLNGRNFLSLAQLSDEVVIPPGGTRATRCNRPGRSPTSAASGQGTTSICSTASR